MIPSLSVIVKKETLNFFADFFPYAYSQYYGDWNIPLWHYKSPYFLSQLEVLYDIWVDKPVFNFSSPYPLYERFSGKTDVFMPRGIFYPTCSMRSLSFRGTGKIKYTKVNNYTSEPVTFRWFVPDSWKDKIGWMENGKIVHRKEIHPKLDGGWSIHPVFIDESIIELNESFIPTLLVAQGNNRIEWQPIPLFPEREKGDFFLDPKDLNPRVE